MATEALKRPYDAFGGAVVPAAKRPRQEVVLAQRNAGALIPSVCILHGIEGPAESSIEKAQLLSFSLSAGSAKDVGSACSCYAVDRARGRHRLWLDVCLRESVGSVCSLVVSGEAVHRLCSGFSACLLIVYVSACP